MGVQLEMIREEIIGLCPVYTEIGNATLIYLKTGEVTVNQGIRSVVAALIRSYAIDLKAQRYQLRLLLNRHGFLPFYLSPQRVFVPLKMRRPLASKDVVYGWFDINYLTDARQCDDGACVIQLTDQRCIEVLSHRITVEQIQNLGRRLLEQLQENPGSRKGSTVVMEAASSWYDTMQCIASTLENIEQLIADQQNRRDNDR